MPRHIARWDLDKTYLRTEFDTFRDLVRTALERPDEKRTNPGAATLLREMVRAGISVHILSGSPEQMRRRLEDKLRLDGIPWDSFTLKPNLQNMLRLRFRALKDQLGYKLPALLQARATIEAASPPGDARSTLPDIGLDDGAPKETLFGDDAEADAFVYSLYADVVAGRVSEDTLFEVCERGRVYPDVLATTLRYARMIEPAAGRRADPDPPRAPEPTVRVPGLRRARRPVLQLPAGRARRARGRAPRAGRGHARRRRARRPAPLRRRRARAQLPRSRAPRPPPRREGGRARGGARGAREGGQAPSRAASSASSPSASRRWGRSRRSTTRTRRARATTSRWSSRTTCGGRREAWVDSHPGVVEELPDPARSRHDVLVLVEPLLLVPACPRHRREHVRRAEPAIEPPGVDDRVRVRRAGRSGCTPASR